MALRTAHHAEHNLGIRVILADVVEKSEPIPEPELVGLENEAHHAAAVAPKRVDHETASASDPTISAVLVARRQECGIASAVNA